MPCCPTIQNPPLEMAFVCVQCTRKFRSKAGCSRHINVTHGASGLRISSPQYTEDDNFPDISSCPGFPSPAPPSYFDTPSRNSDHTFSYGGNDFNVSNSDIPLSPSQDAGRTTSMFTEYHPYLSGKINKI